MKQIHNCASCSDGKATPATFETPEVGSSQQQSPPGRTGQTNEATNPDAPQRRGDDEDEEDEGASSKQSKLIFEIGYLLKHFFLQKTNQTI